MDRSLCPRLVLIAITGSSFMIFGDANNRGADCLLEVDGVSSNFSTKVGGQPNIRRSQLLKEVNGLIPTQRHQVRVSYGQYDSQLKYWLGIDYIMLDERGDGGSELCVQPECQPELANLLVYKQST